MHNKWHELMTNVKKTFAQLTPSLIVGPSDPLPDCYNCGKKHSTECCEYPKFFWSCPRCLTISFKGTNHTSPCMPVNTVSDVRNMIMSRETAPLFRLRFIGVECDVQYLSPNGSFEDMPKKLLSPAASCILTTRGREFQFIEVSTAYFTRFSIGIAIWQNGFWRLRFNAVLTNKHGLLLFKAHSTLNLKNGQFFVPDALKNNNVAIIGLKPKRNELSVLINVFANAAGDPSDDMLFFNGYSGEISWKMVQDNTGQNETTNIAESLDGYLPKKDVKFNARIYYKKATPLGTFLEQRLDAHH